MFTIIRRSYVLFLQKLPLLLLFLLPLLLFETADTAMDKDQFSQFGVLRFLVLSVVRIEVLLIVYTYLLEGKICFVFKPSVMFKFFLLDFAVSLIAFGPGYLFSNSIYLLKTDIYFSEWFLKNSLYIYAFLLILTMLYTLWILPRLSLLYPRFIKGEKISPKIWWQATSDKNWRWLLAGVFICGPDLFSRFWNYNTYVEIVWSNLVLLLPVCFSVVYFKKNREEEK